MVDPAPIDERAVRERMDAAWRTTIDDCGDLRQAYFNAQAVAADALASLLRENEELRSERDDLRAQVRELSTGETE